MKLKTIHALNYLVPLLIYYLFFILLKANLGIINDTFGWFTVVLLAVFTGRWLDTFLEQGNI